MKVKLCTIFSIFLMLISQNIAFAFKVEVHEKITKNAIDIVKSDIEPALKGIGLNNGLVESLNGDDVKGWIEFGSKEEDEPITEGRYLNHFYNPFNSEGLNDYFHGGSSFRWANSNAEWSWIGARAYFSQALKLENKGERDEAFANSFRALGQVMHLVQDMAVPAHVRNDFIYKETLI